MEIQIGDYKLRSWSWDDVEAIAKIANNHKLWINLWDGFPHPFTVNDAKAWLSGFIEDKPDTCFAIANDDEAIDNIRILLQEDYHRKSAEIAY